MTTPAVDTPARPSAPGGNSDLPLLEAVQGLVDKERTLFELKLAEAADEANAWKTRYAQLAASQLNRTVRGGPSGATATASATAAAATALQSALGGDVEGEGDEEGGMPEQGLMRDLELIHHPPTLPVLQLLHSKTGLDLSASGVQPGDLDFVVRSLRRVGPKMAKLPLVLDLSSNELDDTGARSFQKLLKHPLQQLDLSHNELGPASAVALCAGLPNLLYLRSLSINGNAPLASSQHMGEQLVSALRDHGVKLSSLVHLSVTLNDDLGSRLVARGRGKPKAGELSNPFNTLAFVRGAEDLPDVAPMTGRNTFPRLAALGLVGARLLPESTKALAKVCNGDGWMPNLTALDLSFAFIGVHGAELLAHALSKRRGGNETCGLVELNLRHNAIGSVGAAAMARCLHKNEVLTWLDLSHNQIGEAGGLALAQAVQSGAVLAFLSVGGNQMTAAAADTLCRAATRSSTLLSLNGIDQSLATVATRSETDDKLTQRRRRAVCGAPLVWRPGKVAVSASVGAVAAEFAPVHEVDLDTLLARRATLPEHQRSRRLLLTCDLSRSSIDDDSALWWRVLLLSTSERSPPVVCCSGVNRGEGFDTGTNVYHLTALLDASVLRPAARLRLAVCPCSRSFTPLPPHLAGQATSVTCRRFRLSWQLREESTTARFNDCRPSSALLGQDGPALAWNPPATEAEASPVAFTGVEQQQIDEARVDLEVSYGRRLALTDGTAAAAQCVRRLLLGSPSVGLAVEFQVRAIPLTDTAAADLTGFDWLVTRETPSAEHRVLAHGRHNVSRDPTSLLDGEAEDQQANSTLALWAWVGPPTGAAAVQGCEDGDVLMVWVVPRLRRSLRRSRDEALTTIDQLAGPPAAAADVRCQIRQFRVLERCGSLPELDGNRCAVVDPNTAAQVASSVAVVDYASSLPMSHCFSGADWL